MQFFRNTDLIIAEEKKSLTSFHVDNCTLYTIVNRSIVFTNIVAPKVKSL